MSRLIILQGTPCAGKSTWARNQVAGRDDIVIVSRDDIRHSLGDYWVLRREKYVSDIEDHMILHALKMQFDVISDATNLTPERVNHLNKLADEAEAIVEFQKLYVPFREAARRDMNADRPHHVGEKSIREFYEKHFPEKLAEELANPEPETNLPDTPQQLPCRIMTDTEGNTIWIPTPSDLDNVKKLAILRFKISDIALALGVPEAELRRHMANKESNTYMAYRAGKIESEMDYRDKVRGIAARGEEWAIKMVEAWNREQLKEELGFKL